MPGHIELVSVQKRREVAGAGEHAGSIGFKAEHGVGGEAAPHMANESPVQSGQNHCRIAGRFR